MEARKGWLRIVNWRPLQKYQKPNPPWIKLFTSLLADEGPDSKWKARERWEGLGAGGQSLLVNLWLYAAVTTTDGVLFSDPDFLRRGLATDAPIELEPLFAAGFIEWVEPESRAEISKSEPEGEGEGEGEAERETKPLPPQAAEAKRERERKSGSAPSSRSAGAEREQSPTQGVSQSQNQSPKQGTGTSGAQAQAKVPESARSVPVIGNPHPPCGIRSFPPESDVGPKTAPRPGPPSKGPPARPGDAVLLGKCLPQALRQRADPVKYSWIAEVYRRLRFPYAMDSPVGRQELGSFESVYEELMAAGLPQSAKMEILAHDLDWAEKNGPKKRNRKRGAVFCKVHNERLATYLARAGPSG